MQWIENSETVAARRRIPFECVDGTDLFTPKTGLTFASTDLLLSKNGAAAAAFAGTVIEEGGGLYFYEATQAEVNTFGILTLRVNKATVYGKKFPVQIVNHDPYGMLSADAQAIAGATQAAISMKRVYLQVLIGVVATAPVAPTNVGFCVFQATGIGEQTADHMNGRSLLFDTGVMQASELRILDYAWDGVNSQSIFTCTVCQETPVNGTNFLII